MGVVIFNVEKFKKLYPRFTLSDEQLEMFFTKASMILNNTDCSCVKSLVDREMLLYLLVAHFAALQVRIDSGNDSVGRVSSASEGSVSVSLDYGASSNSEKWYTQTPYGAEYWQLTAQYRSGLYIATQYAMPVNRNGGRPW